MKRRPAGLKHLVERRARAAGDEMRLRTLMRELGKELAAVRRIVASCDNLIRDFNPNLDPRRIKPIRKVARVFNGERGALRAAIIEAVQSRAPDPIYTTEVAVHVVRRFQLDFQTKDDFQRWEHNSVAKQLKRLVDLGLIERVATKPLVTWEGVRWRWKSASGLSEDRLLALIEGEHDSACPTEGATG